MLFACERFHAKHTFVDISGVYAGMVGEVIFPSKSLRTVVAFEGRFSSVLPHVVNKMLFSCECFQTIFTARRLVGVTFDMIS